MRYSILRYFNVVGSDFLNGIGPINQGTLFRNIASNIVKKKYQINVFGKSF